MSFPTERLVAEALAKSGLLWISSDVGSAPVWHAVSEGCAYVVSGEGEQHSPAHEGRAHVIARAKESRARLVSFEADTSTMSPQDEDWEAATAALKAGRLNAPAGDVVARWAEHGVITRIRPDLSTVVLRGRLLPEPETEPSDAPEPESAATRPVPQTAGPGGPSTGARVSE